MKSLWARLGACLAGRPRMTDANQMGRGSRSAGPAVSCAASPKQTPPRFHLFRFEAEPLAGLRPQPRLIDCAGLEQAGIQAAIAMAQATLHDEPRCERVEIWADGRCQDVVARPAKRRVAASRRRPPGTMGEDLTSRL